MIINAELVDSCIKKLEVTIIPINSRVFEHVLLSLREDVLYTDELQFGFTKARSCTDAIITLKIAISHFNAKDSSVHHAVLDIKKTFDSVNRNKLFSSLLLRGVPNRIINVLCDWYSKHIVRVRWGALSDVAVVSCGVRQGGVISPVLYCLMFLLTFYQSLTFSTHRTSCKWSFCRMFVLCE